VSRTFNQLLADREVTPAFYVTIAGLPLVFADFDQPAHWTLPAGMAWSRTLVPFHKSGEAAYQSFLQAVSEAADWRTGMPISGNLDLQFLVDEDDPDDTWLNLVVPKGRNTWFMDGHHVHRPSDTLWRMISTTSLEGEILAPGTIVHCGIGCAEVEAVLSAEQFADGGGPGIKVAPNQFGSYFDWRGSVGFERGTPRGGNVQVTSWPKVWARRQVSVWVELCGRDRRGNRVALSESFKQYEGGAGREIFIGECATAPVWHANEPAVTLLCQDLTQPLSRTLITRARKYKPGPMRRGMGSVFVEREGPCLIEVVVEAPWEGGGALAARRVIDLTDPDYGWDWSSIIPGDELIRRIEAALNALGGMYVGSLIWEVSSDAGGVDDETRRPKLRLGVAHRRAVGMTTRIASILVPVKVLVKTATESNRAILRALGCEDDLVFDPPSETALDPPIPYVYAFGSEEIPHYYFAPGNTRLYYHGGPVDNQLCDDPPHSQGTFSATGRPDGVYIRFGEHEVLEVAFRREWAGGGVLVDYLDEKYAQVKRRQLMGAKLPVSIPWDEFEDEQHEIVVGLGFFNHDLHYVLKCLLVSNGDRLTGGPWDDPMNAYNVLPQGFGAEVPANLIHDGSFELSRLNSWQPRAYALWIEQALTARELLAEVAVACGVNFLSRWDGARRKLGVVKMQPPTEVNPVLDLDDSWVDDAQTPVQADYDEMGIRNRIAFEYDYDPLEDKFHGIDNTFLDMNSIANYGTSDPIDMRVRWLGSLGDSLAQLSGVAAALFRRYADPIVGYQVTFMRPEGWKAIPGDYVNVTKSRVPNFRDGGLGLTNVPMRVESISNEYGPEPKFGEMRLAWFENRQAIPWSPCIRLKSVLDNGWYSVYRQGQVGDFTAREDGRSDLDFFEIGEIVQAFRPGVDELLGPFKILALAPELGEIQLEGSGGDETLYSAIGVTLGDDRGYSVVTATESHEGAGGEFAAPGQDARTGTLRVTVVGTEPDEITHVVVYIEGVWSETLSVNNIQALGDLTAGVSVLIEVAAPWDIVVSHQVLSVNADYTILVELVGGGGLEEPDGLVLESVPFNSGDETLYSRSEALGEDESYSVVTDASDVEVEGAWPTPGEDARTGTLRVTVTFAEADGYVSLELYLGGAYDSTIDVSALSGVPQTIAVDEPWDLVVYNNGSSLAFTVLVELVGGGGGDETLYSASGLVAEGTALYSVARGEVVAGFDGPWGSDARAGTLRITVTYVGSPTETFVARIVGGSMDWDSLIDLLGQSGVPQTLEVEAGWDLVIALEDVTADYLVELVGGGGGLPLPESQKDTVFMVDDEGFVEDLEGNLKEGAKWG
jgi:hypothetical protein